MRLLSRVMEEIDYRKLDQAYSQAGRKAALQGEVLFKIIAYGYMNGIYSSRKLEEACRRDTHFMFLLEGHPVPDHSAIARFRRERLKGEVGEDLFCQLVMLLTDATLCSRAIEPFF